MGTWNNRRPRRKRKLLMYKAQIVKIHNKVKEGGYTIVPLSLYFSGGRAQVEVAVAQGQREYDLRSALWERQDNSEAARAIFTRRKSATERRRPRRPRRSAMGQPMRMSFLFTNSLAP